MGVEEIRQREAERGVANKIAGLKRSSALVRRFGVVTQVVGNEVVVTLGSETVANAITARYMAQYTPTVNDVVVVYGQDDDWIVHGKLA